MGWEGAKFAAKCVITALLLWFAFRTVDPATVSSLFLSADPWWAGIALVTTGVLIVSDAILLAAVMRMVNGRIALRTALLYSLVGWFFSNVAPSTVGGDIFRGIQLSRVGTPVGTAIRVILSIRLLSLATLVVVMLAGFPIAAGLLESRDVFLLAATLGSAAAAVIALFLLARFGWRNPATARWALVEKLKTISSGFRGLLVPTSDSGVAWSAALSQHLLRVGTIACLGMALGLGIPLSTLFALVPAALLVAMVPVSIGGWGVRELTFVYFLGAARVSGEAALSLSVAFGLLRIFVGIIGGLAWVLLKQNQFRVDPGPESNPPLAN